MDSDNPTSADNQQERLKRVGWVVGFVDGEGCFSAPVVKNQKMTLGWQVQPVFSVVQGASSGSVLFELVDFFGCGKVYVNKRHDNHREDLLRYGVSKRPDLITKIVPFFVAHPLQTEKRRNFEKFSDILELIEAGHHLTVEGLANVARISQTMNHRKPSEFLRILRDHTPTISTLSR